MILLMAGTSEGRELARLLTERGYCLLVTTVSEYAGSLLDVGIESINGALDEDDLSEIIREREIRFLIDATHPFAVEASTNAQQAALRTGIEYIRWEREEVEKDAVSESQIYRVQDTRTAVKLLGDLPFRRILLTVGSKELPLYAPLLAAGDKQIFVRVLPLPGSLQLCWEMKIPTGQIIACQGPFSREWNEAVITQYQIQILVSKESGARGGVKEKIGAAISCGIPMMLIERPGLTYLQVVRNFKQLETILHR